MSVNHLPSLQCMGKHGLWWRSNVQRHPKAVCMSLSSSGEPQWILWPIFLGFDCLQCFHYALIVKAGELTQGMGTVSPSVTSRNLEYPSSCFSGYSASPLEVIGHTPWWGVATANLGCQFDCLERKPKHKLLGFPKRDFLDPLI